MYTPSGLRTVIAKMEAKEVEKEHFAEALEYMIKYFDEMKRAEEFGRNVLQKQTPMSQELMTYAPTIDVYKNVLRESTPTVTHALFLEALDKMEALQGMKNQIFDFIFEQIEHMPKKQIPTQCFMFAAHGEAIHKLGFIPRSFEDGITVHAEIGDYYIGHYWYSCFVNVLFAKNDVRPLTEKELAEAN